MTPEESTPRYVGINKDGKAVAAAVDHADKETAKFLSRCVRDGLYIERTTVAMCHRYLGKKWPAA